MPIAGHQAGFIAELVARASSLRGRVFVNRLEELDLQGVAQGRMQWLEHVGTIQAEGTDGGSCPLAEIFTRNKASSVALQK